VPDATSNMLIKGGNLWRDGNKGDYLMFLALERFLDSLHFPHRKVLSLSSGPYPERAKHGCHQLLWPGRISRLSGTLGHLMLRRYGESFGIVAESEIDVVLNISGYRYFDLGRRETEADARQLGRIDAGARIVFLPQAYGPFKLPATRKSIRALFSREAMVFARDDISRRFLLDVLRDGRDIPVVPDITIGIEGARPDHEFEPGRVAIIPSPWMIERTRKETSDHYLKCLECIIEHLDRAGKRWFFLCHAPAQDEDVRARMESRLGSRVTTVRETDPLHLKWMLGTCSFVVSSRYHGLVNSLSQNVPAIATSWSHKYEGLMRDYGMGEFLADPASYRESIPRLISILSDSSRLEELAARLEEKNALFRRKLAGMWQAVEGFIR
jgi:polysaccharide pyruvyl transferase WcaK-like protein